MTQIERGWMQLFEFLYLLARTELKARYKGRLLGYVWSVGTTFAIAFVFWIAFKIIMRVDITNYSVYLIAGLFPWVWLNASVIAAARSFVANAPLVREIGVAHAILPMSNVMAEMMHFVLALPLVIAWVILPGDHPPAVAWLWQVPLMMALQVAFAYPLALICALVNAFVRDVDYLLGIGFLLLFFVTPMVYPISMVPDSLVRYFELNPFHALMASWRSVLLEDALAPGSMAYAAAFALAAGAIAFLLYRRLGPRVGEVL
ncbi:MAG TPA: ABC transporter permease [Vicinamibacterales bacterium]|nr:ABC transporter permease [Vicinamibacterales bacterium]